MPPFKVTVRKDERYYTEKIGFRQIYPRLFMVTT